VLRLCIYLRNAFALLRAAAKPRLAIFVATGLSVGCPSKQPEAPRADDDSALRVRIAHAEARRAAGVDELLELAQPTHDMRVRELALRGLGRVGGDKAIAALEAALDDQDVRIVAAACFAIGVLGSLDDNPKWQPGGKLLLSALPRTPLPALEALGRAGEAAAQAELATRVADKDPAIAAAAAHALARHGRRKLAWSPDARAALAKATAHTDSNVRYAATYALAREHEPPADEEVNAALVARIPDDNPETRAQAIAGLAKRPHVIDPSGPASGPERSAIGAGRAQIEESLRDRDWRVAVEAVRALAGANGDAAGRMLVANSFAVRLAELSKGNEAEAHVVIEALRLFVERPLEDRAQMMLALEAVASAKTLAPLTRGWIQCSSAPTVDAVLSCGLPDHLRLTLLVDLTKSAAITAKRAALRVLLAHDDPRVRAAGLNVLPETWKESDAKGQATIVGTIASAIATKNPIVAGTAVDIAGTVYDLIPPGDPLRTNLDTAITTRARTETDVEISASLYGIIGKRAIAGGAEICRAGLAGAPARAKAAAECLRALGEATALPTASAAEPPPGDPASVIGKKLFWHLTTTRGEIVIELRPDVAPWAVTSIVALTKRGFYDGLEFHRVVPNFVVQGGDPTQSGWGGPGYSLPAEPASSADGAGYVQGGVGMADSGRDSGGSQWFIMHSRAPHLDGRYTWIGSVVSGQKSADALLIGDKVEKARIEQK
jgi:cyclophilin family peptidyl-prolyl cis-trans isomerase